jgi:phage head maturation protease
MRDIEMEYKGLIATDQIDANGNCLTKEVLDQMAKQAKGVRVTWNFDPNIVLGHISESVRTDKGVEVEIEVDANPMKETLDHVISLGALYGVSSMRDVESHMEDGVRVIDKMKLTEIALTPYPADKSLPPVEEN